MKGRVCRICGADIRGSVHAHMETCSFAPSAMEVAEKEGKKK
jgi:hypothetical protein